MVQIEFMERLTDRRVSRQRHGEYVQSAALNDLIWNTVINNYLMGNAARVRSSAILEQRWHSYGPEAHSFYLHNTYLENNLMSRANSLPVSPSISA
jgi:polyhydroxyalkanoate synthase